MYTAKATKQKSEPGYIDHQLVEIFKGEEKVGEFVRNYSSYGESTFFPFERDGKWYALYSRSYVALSVMSLPDCKHLGGEDEKNGFGFCPVETFIPQYQYRPDPRTPEEEMHKYPKENHHWLCKDRKTKYYEDYKEIWQPELPVLYENFAFVSGCIWGDDSSWQIELRDISKAHEGILRSVPDWGYHSLPDLKLKECVRLSAFQQNEEDPDDSASINATITITKTIRINRKDGDIKLKHFD